MYRAIVRTRYRRTWRAMNAPDYRVVLDQLAPDLRVTFIRDTSLGGTRRTLPAMDEWAPAAVPAAS